MVKSNLLTVTFVWLSLLASAQIDTNFWNKAMTQLAEANSIRGWIRIKPEQNFTVNNFIY